MPPGSEQAAWGEQPPEGRAACGGWLRAARGQKPEDQNAGRSADAEPPQPPDQTVGEAGSDGARSRPQPKAEPGAGAEASRSSRIEGSGKEGANDQLAADPAGRGEDGRCRLPRRRVEERRRPGRSGDEAAAAAGLPLRQEGQGRGRHPPRRRCRVPRRRRRRECRAASSASTSSRSAPAPTAAPSAARKTECTRTPSGQTDLPGPQPRRFDLPRRHPAPAASREHGTRESRGDSFTAGSSSAAN